MKTYKNKEYPLKKAVSYGRTYYYDHVTVTVSSGDKFKICEMMRDLGLNSTREAISVLMRCWEKHPEAHEEAVEILKAAKELVKGGVKDAIQTPQE